ncbi:MAG: T9SS type A sorting domain-containing protein [Salinibacter sp.]
MSYRPVFLPSLYTRRRIWIRLPTGPPPKKRERAGARARALQPQPALSPTARHRFVVDRSADVTIAVYDVLGRRGTTLADSATEAGRHTAHLDAGHPPSGTYFVRMRANDFRQTRRLTIVR